MTEPVRGRLRRNGWTRLSRGLHIEAASRTPTADLQAWSLLLPAGSAFTHLTAAAAYGWWQPAHDPAADLRRCA